jgi:hypothetical protein
MNVRRRYILKPYVQKRFQQLCSAATPIEEKTLFPNDITRRMKEINDASKINKQLSNQNFQYRGSKNFRGKPAYRGSRGFNNYRGNYRGNPRGYRGANRGRYQSK